MQHQFGFWARIDVCWCNSGVTLYSPSPPLPSEALAGNRRSVDPLIWLAVVLQGLKQTYFRFTSPPPHTWLPKKLPGVASPGPTFYFQSRWRERQISKECTLHREPTDELSFPDCYWNPLQCNFLLSIVIFQLSFRAFELNTRCSSAVGGGIVLQPLIIFSFCWNLVCVSPPHHPLTLNTQIIWIHCHILPCHNRVCWWHTPHVVIGIADMLSCLSFPAVRTTSKSWYKFYSLP